MGMLNSYQDAPLTVAIDPLQASNTEELQQLQQQLLEAQAALSQEQEQARRELSEAQEALSSEQARGAQQDRQLAQMVEAQRRLGLELQEGEEAREQAEASKSQAQVSAVNHSGRARLM